MNETDEQFIECEWDPVFEVYRLSLHWWVTYKVSLKPFQLKALRRVIDRVLEKGK